ncbi:hypothetical protein DYD21_02105 [Rhodohalobacter sp. SW132]|nr:hypothetical protein DYD21_02105 [Rhodohalobacter sp. SW132]
MIKAGFSFYSEYHEIRCLFIYAGNTLFEEHKAKMDMYISIWRLSPAGLINFETKTIAPGLPTGK